MKLSKESQYGLLALAYLAQQPEGTRLEAGELAGALGLPRPFLSKVLRRLVQHGLLQAFRGGRVRGYRLARPPHEIPVQEVLVALEGPDLFRHCIFWSDLCSEEAPCPLHGWWQDVRAAMLDRLSRLTLADLLQEGGPG